VIAEALDALWSLGAALLIWLAIIATAAVLALEALAVGLYLAARAAWARTRGAARQTGRRAIGIERHEPYAEAAARRLNTLVLPLEGGAA
jgi:hypothetical protein